MELTELNYSLISSPYDSFMRKHLQHYGYFSGRGEVMKKYGFLPPKSQLTSSSGDSDSDSSDEHRINLNSQKFIERTSGYSYRVDFNGQLNLFLEHKGKSFNPDSRPIRPARAPYGLTGRGPHDESSFEPLWPIEIEVLNEPRIKHINVAPLEPELFHKPNSQDRGPIARSYDENNGRVVFKYSPETCGYFIRSRIGGTREGCRDVAVQLRNTDDTTVIFESRFESGNLMKAVQVGEFDYELYLRYDLYTKRNTQWFYFRLQNIQADKRYRFTIVNFFKPTSLYSCGMKPLLYSVMDAEKKGIGWRRWGEEILYYKNNLSAPDNSSSNLYSLTWTCKFPNNNDTYYFAHCYPYTYSDLQDYLAEIQTDHFKKQYCKQKVLCRTLAGNRIYMLTITNSDVIPANTTSTSTERQTKKGVVVTARVHPGETNGSWMMKGLLDFLLGDSDDARLLRDNFVFKIIPMLNPDGVIVGNYRCSLSGRDLNRNYKTILKDAYPSIWHTREMIKRFMNEIELVLYCDFHGHSRKQNVFVYGCENKHLPGERFKERIFPFMLAKNDPTKFSFDSCKFKVQKHKEGTGRVVMWSLGILNSYTLEATFCGSTLRERTGHHFNTKDLESVGYHFLDSLLDYCDPDHTKGQNYRDAYDRLLEGDLITHEDLIDFLVEESILRRSKTRVDMKKDPPIPTKVRSTNSRNIKSAPITQRSKSRLVLPSKRKGKSNNSSRSIAPSSALARNRALTEMDDLTRNRMRNKLLARGANPALLDNMDLDQFSSDDDSSDDAGSDSSIDDGLPKHLEVIAAAKSTLKKPRKKVALNKTGKDGKRRDELDKENVDKPKAVGLPLSKNRNTQFPNIDLLETTVVTTDNNGNGADVNELTKPFPPNSARRLDSTIDSVRYEGSNAANNRPNRWPTLTQTQITSSRPTTTDEKSRRSQAEYYRLLTRDMPGDNEEKQAIPQQVQPSPSAQAQARLLEEEILLTSSSFFPNQRPPSSARRSGEECPIRYSSLPAAQVTDLSEVTVLNEPRDAFTATYLLRRMNSFDRDATPNVSMVSYPTIPAPSSRADDDTVIPLTTDNEGDFESSRIAVFHPADDGRHFTSAYAANRLSTHLNDRLIGTARSQGRPKSTSSTIPRTVLDIRAVQPPIPPPNLRRISEQQQHSRQRVMMVFGKQGNGEATEKSSSTGSRSFHLSINEHKPEERKPEDRKPEERKLEERKPDERKADDTASIPDNASTIVSKLYPIQPDNMAITLSSRYDLSLLSRSQIFRASSVKKASK